MTQWLDSVVEKIFSHTFNGGCMLLATLGILAGILWLLKVCVAMLRALLP